MRYVDVHWFCSSSRDSPFDLKNLLRRCFSVLYILKKNDHYFLELFLSLVITSHFFSPSLLHNKQITEIPAQGPLDDDQTYNSGIIHSSIAKDKQSSMRSWTMPGLNARLQGQLTLLLVDYINNS